MKGKICRDEIDELKKRVNTGYTYVVLIRQLMYHTYITYNTSMTKVKKQ